MGVSKATRAAVFIAVLAIHLIFLAALIEASRARKQLPVPETIVSTLIYLPAAVPRALTASRPRKTVRAPATLPALTEAGPPVPPLWTSQAPAAEPYIDWMASAHEVARDLLKADAKERVLSSQMGTGWWLALDAKQQRRMSRSHFPWSRQQQHAWVDFNPATFVTTFTLNRRCQVSVFLIVPGFGCVLGHLDPEPGRSDLFDPKYLPGPIELPQSGAPLP